MALELNSIELAYGITAQSTYNRIENIKCTKNTITFHTRSYVDSNKPFFAEDIITTDYILDGDNPFKQGYEYLKTLPSFSGSVDC